MQAFKLGLLQIVHKARYGNSDFKEVTSFKTAIKINQLPICPARGSIGCVETFI